MGVILTPRISNHDASFPNSLSISRKKITLHNRAIVFKSLSWLFEHQMESPHIIIEQVNPSHNAKDGIGQPTHEVERLPNTPGATPLRTHSIVSSTEHLLDISTTSLPSLLPATGTTLVVPPSLSTTTSSTSIFMSSGILTAMATSHSTRPYSAPSVTVTQTKIHLRLPVAAIAAIAAGGSCVLIVSFLLFRWLRTPQRRRIPRPSLPKLVNSDMDEKDEDGPPQESPVFGPKERFSQRPGFHPTWSWVTYPRNNPASEENGKFSGDITVGQSPDATATPYPPKPVAAADFHHKNNFPIYPARGHFHTLSAPVGSPSLGAGHPSLHQLQTAITRATDRMSAMSFACASSCSNTRDTGATFTADGHNVLKRQSRTLRKSRSNSVYEDRRRLSRASTGIAYDGADVNSPEPIVEFMPLDSPGLEDGYDFKAERRTRIQVPYYTAGSYPRISSAIPTTYGVATRVKLGEGTSIGGVPSPKSTLETHHGKDPPRVLGLASLSINDSAPSPHPTLYPDDSLSIVESKRLLKHKSQRKRVSVYPGDLGQSNQVSDGHRKHIFATPMPTRSVVAVASGSLVSAEDIKALAAGNNPLRPGLVGTKSTSTLASSKIVGRADDKPPRVPSPPPLPSLAQMALEHNNPDGYTSYHSPTYSIYNLYDDNRRSTLYGGKQPVNAGR